jgi:hypothetical protein
MFLIDNFVFRGKSLRTKEAQEVYEKALFYDRNNPDIYYNVSFRFRQIYANVSTLFSMSG